MKRYKDNEDARDKFVSEQRQELSKGAKKGPVISASDGNPISGESSEGWGAMFGGSDDLALQRKKELASGSGVASGVATGVATGEATATVEKLD
jgi:hypothetical protein